MDITPLKLLKAYALGVFPMSEARDDDSIFWVEPEERGVIMLDNFHVSRSLRKKLKKEHYDVYFDKDFNSVIRACAEPAKGREETWINDIIIDLYSQLFELGFVHTVEAYDKQGLLVGGLYGVSLGSAFFGESMFSKKDDASKYCLAHLVAKMKTNGFSLLDTQFVTDHLKSLGAVEIKKQDYHNLLQKAMKTVVEFKPYKDYDIDILFEKKD